LSQESLEAMQTPSVQAAHGGQFGLSWFVRELAGVRLISHGGATNGQMSAFWMIPARDFACTLLTNADDGTLLNNAVSNFIRKTYLGLEELDPPALPFEPSLEPLLGAYREDNFGTVLHFDWDGENLCYTVEMGDYSSFLETPPPTPPPARFEFCSSHAVRVVEGEAKGMKGEFLTDSSGQKWLRTSRLFRKLG